ncbi:MAG: hypothetical protein ACI9N9_002467 [Enterobacterales bacterium]|jgi:hypothetical protein
MKFRITIIVFFLFFLAGCSKLSLDNYDKLDVGMKYDEVTDVIGSPESCKEKLGTRSCIWGDKDGSYIKANFIAGSAIHFSHKKLN